MTAFITTPRLCAILEPLGQTHDRLILLRGYCALGAELEQALVPQLDTALAGLRQAYSLLDDVRERQGLPAPTGRPGWSRPALAVSCDMIYQRHKEVTS